MPLYAVHASLPPKDAAFQKDAFGERRLARVDVREDTDVEHLHACIVTRTGENVKNGHSFRLLRRHLPLI